MEWSGIEVGNISSVEIDTLKRRRAYEATLTFARDFCYACW